MLGAINLSLEDSYFIRLTDQEDAFIHPVGEIVNHDEDVYFSI